MAGKQAKILSDPLLFAEITRRLLRNKVIVLLSAKAGSIFARQNPEAVVFNSMSQPGPEGGALAGDGRHGSMIPNSGRVRSRRDMGALT